MLFLVGPRQVGKTTTAQLYQKQFSQSLYLNWDVISDRQKILSGQNFIEDIFSVSELRATKPLIIFDEIHKFKNWKNYLKGFYDLYKNHFNILVTGSARLDIYQAGGDSLMGRYFQCRIHPLSVRERLIPNISKNIVSAPKEISSADFQTLYRFGGFPNPFLQASTKYSIRWQTLRNQQLFHEDIRSLSQIHEIAQLEILADLLKFQTGQLLNRSNLANKIQVTVQTVSSWTKTLERFYFCFLIRPWTKNVARSLIKEPKLYLWDWSQVTDEGARFENFIASHLLKAVHLWTDLGLGNFGLFYLRDKSKREVDFIVTRDDRPWFLVEAKSSRFQRLSPSLEIFQLQTKAPHAFQVVKDADFVDQDCFEYTSPIIVPAKTLLPQLV